MSWKRAAFLLVRPGLKTHARLTRGVTLGVRGVIFDGEGRVCLIRHTYAPGWYLPGGGVERNETTEEALARELEEEAGVRVEGSPTLLGVYSNARIFKGDHVIIYRVDEWSACEMTSVGEIAEVEWFAPDALPKGVTPGTVRRIEEALGERAPSVFW